MCIRDRHGSHIGQGVNGVQVQVKGIPVLEFLQGYRRGARPCLLYTSDAADERSSVDLGGRRIIKKTKRVSLAHPTVTP